MSFVNVLAFLATAQAVAADSSHPMHFRKVDAQTAKSIAAFKNTTAGSDLVNEQVRRGSTAASSFTRTRHLTPFPKGILVLSLHRRRQQ